MNKSMKAVYIDSHVNLHAPAFDGNRQEVIDRARSAGVGVMLNICDYIDNFTNVIEVANSDPLIWATIGTHPHEAKRNPNLKPDDILERLNDHKIVGIGECGLDYHYDLSPRSVQRDVFRAHIQAAQASNLPLVVHSREADDDMEQILNEEMKRKPFRFLMHCYTSSQQLANAAADLGAYFSVSGIATFKSATDVRSVIKTMPDNRILVETDCPYLAPVPMRGRCNEPSYIGYVYEILAEIKSWPKELAIQKANIAFYTLFDRISNESDLDQREQIR
jgi:TatD DNase family protein